MLLGGAILLLLGASLTGWLTGNAQVRFTDLPRIELALPAQAYPVSLERLELWTATLEAKGLALAPVSAFLIEGSDSLRGQSSHVERASRPEG